VKLFAAIGAIAGAKLGIEVELLSLSLAAVHAFARLAWEGKLVRTLLNSFWIAVNVVLPPRRRRDIPPELMSSVRMGGAVLAATILAFADGISILGLIP
jgi:prepilin peptidase CpaA